MKGKSMKNRWRILAFPCSVVLPFLTYAAAHTRDVYSDITLENENVYGGSIVSYDDYRIHVPAGQKAVVSWQRTSTKTFEGSGYLWVRMDDESGRSELRTGSAYTCEVWTDHKFRTGASLSSRDRVVVGTMVVSTYALGGTLPYSFNRYGLSPNAHVCCGYRFQVRYSKLPVSIPVSFNAEGGSVSTSSKKVTEGTVYGTLPVPTRKGYIFEGWYTAAVGGTRVTALSTAPGSAITLHAHWEKYVKGSYKAYFDKNGGSGSMAIQKRVSGKRQALPANTFARTGHTFGGWALSAGGKAVYKNKETVDFAGGKDITLYAVWTPNVYEVKFVANGGSGYMLNQRLTYGETIALDSCLFTRAGYHLAGWATSAKGKVVHQDGERVCNLTTKAKGVVSLYAIWAQGSPDGKYADLIVMPPEPSAEVVETGKPLSLSVCVVNRGEWAAPASKLRVIGEWNRNYSFSYSQTESGGVKAGAVPPQERFRVELDIGPLLPGASVVKTVPVSGCEQEGLYVFTALANCDGLVEEPRENDSSENIVTVFDPAASPHEHVVAYEGGYAINLLGRTSVPFIVSGGIISAAGDEQTYWFTSAFGGPCKFQVQSHLVGFTGYDGEYDWLAMREQELMGAEAVYVDVYDAAGRKLARASTWGEDAMVSLQPGAEYRLALGVALNGSVGDSAWREELLENLFDYELMVVPSGSGHRVEVRFDSNGAVGDFPAQSYSRDEVCVYRDLPQPIRYGWRFDGWFAEYNGEHHRVRDGDFVVFAVSELRAHWSRDAYADDEKAFAGKAATYDGVLYDGGLPVGRITVKAGARDKKKKTSKLTVTLAEQSAKSVSCTGHTADGRCLKFLTSKKAPVDLELALGADGLTGRYGRLTVAGVRRTSATAYKGSWTITDDGTLGGVRVQLKIDAKGGVTIKGLMADGTVFSAKSQLLVGNGFSEVPVLVELPGAKGSACFVARISDGYVDVVEGGVIGWSDAYLLTGGRTERPSGGSCDLSLADTMLVGFPAAFWGACAVEAPLMAYPVKFTATGLPPGVKVNATTGAITGRPTKKGTYRPVFKITSGANSKWVVTKKATVTVQALSQWMQGTFSGSVCERGTTTLIGRADLSVAATGKISGKMIWNGRTYVLSGSGYDAASMSLNDDWNAGSVMGVVQAKCGSETTTFDLTVAKIWYEDGTLASAAVLEAGTLCEALLQPTPWKKGGFKRLSAAMNKKTLTLTAKNCPDLPSGSKIVLKFATGGKMTAKGTFPTTGKTYQASGSFWLVPQDDGVTVGDGFLGEVNLWFPPNKKGKFNGLLLNVSVKWAGGRLAVEEQ